MLFYDDDILPVCTEDYEPTPWELQVYAMSIDELYLELDILCHKVDHVKHVIECFNDVNRLFTQFD
jgi:hypothetical protein